MSNRPTVIMRSKNSDWVIAEALAALFSQDFKDFDLLVVDSGSTDRTLEIVSRFACRVERIDAKDYFPGAVLNRAIELTDSDTIVFQNSDAVPLSPCTLGRLIDAVSDANVVAAFSRQIPRPDAETWVRRDYAESFPEAGPAPPWMTLSLPMAAMRRSAWEDHPFYMDAWGSEDTEWGKWARDRGWQVRYVPDAIVMHSHNYTLRQIYGRRFIEGEADAFIYRDVDSLAREARRYVAAVLRDAAAHARAGDVAGLLRSPLRRAVHAWGYFRGHRHGERRIAAGDRDLSVGQEAVLSRHESVR